jgi:hypothetical protein
MACDGCTCGAAETENLVVGDGATVPATTGGRSLPLPRVGLQSFTSPRGQLSEETEGNKPVKPLRSKKWFNDPNDPGESALCLR